MKIAVISDIHGNMQALNAVMENIEAQGCDKIFILGDYAMAGPQPKKAIQFFMDKLNNNKYKMIQGNTDLMLAKYSDDLYDMLQDSAPIMAEALKFDANELDNLEKAFLLTLPEKLEVKEGGVKFLLVHGSPRKNNEDILPDIRLDKVEELKAFFASHK